MTRMFDSDSRYFLCVFFLSLSGPLYIQVGSTAVPNAVLEAMALMGVFISQNRQYFQRTFDDCSEVFNML
jgi:hypothetical protein